MYGRESTKPVASSQIAPTPSPASGAQLISRASGDPEQTAQVWFPYALAIAVVLYFVWAIVEQHQRVKSALKPQAIGINLRNLAVMLTTVILGLNIFKIAAVKYSAFTGGKYGGRLLVYLAGGA
jgi:hypothetical protein